MFFYLAWAERLSFFTSEGHLFLWLLLVCLLHVLGDTLKTGNHLLISFYIITFYVNCFMNYSFKKLCINILIHKISQSRIQIQLDSFASEYFLSAQCCRKQRLPLSQVYRTHVLLIVVHQGNLPQVRPPTISKLLKEANASLEHLLVSKFLRNEHLAKESIWQHKAELLKFIQ